MKNKGYYEILEVTNSADKITIKRAYKKMAMKYHPDKNIGNAQAEENFKYVNEAYQVLSDTSKRTMYDRGGKEAVQGVGQQGGFGGFEDISDIFNDFFSGGSSGHQRSRGSRSETNYGYELDAMIELNISFKEAVFGCKKTLEYAYKSACGGCNGNGAKNGQVQTCGHCNGSGNISIGGGFINIAQTCPYCKGVGAVAASKCNDCSGKGSKNNKTSFEISIPAGVNTDNQMRVGAKGNKAPNGDRGELYVNIKVGKHEYFLRDDDDIYFQAPILFTKAILGAKIIIPSLKGDMEINIPPRTKDKHRFTFNGAGVKNVNSNHKGNYIVQVEIIYPKKLSAEQKELVFKLQDSFDKQESVAQDVFSKIKSWF